MLAERNQTHRPESSPDGFRGRLARSWRLHVDHPSLFALPLLVGTLSIVGAALVATTFPGPQQFARSFGPPPLGFFNDLRLLDEMGHLWMIPIALAIRVLALRAYGHIVGGRPKALSLMLVFIVGYGFHLLLALAAIGYLMAARMGSAGIFVLLLAVPIIHLAAAGAGVALISKAIFGGRVRDHLSSLAVWITVGLGTWLWMMFSQRLETLEGSALGYVIASALLVAQGILMIAAILPRQVSQPSAE